MLDAYTVRKAIPRIVLAVIGINLSIYLCVALIDMTNVVGQGLGKLITTPFKIDSSFGSGVLGGTANNITFGVSVALAFFTTGVIWKIFKKGGRNAVRGIGVPLAIGAVGILIPIVISLALISLAVVFTLIIRQALLIFLTIISPVAIALFVLPGTEKYFKKWFDMFIKTLLVYPIIAVLFAVSSAMTSILVGTSAASPDLIAPTKAIAAIIVAFAPLVMIPFAFKLAGGAIGAIMNAAGGKAGNLSSRAGQGWQNWRKNPNSWLGKQDSSARASRLESRLTGAQMFSGLSRGLGKKIQTGTDENGNPIYESFGQAYQRGASGVAADKSLADLEHLSKLESMQQIIGNDDYLFAGASVKGADGKWRARTDQEMFDELVARKYSTADALAGVEAINRAKSATNQEDFDRLAAVSLPGTGTAWKEGNREGEGFAAMTEFISHAAGHDKALKGNLMARARQGATQARRTDLLPGFGTAMGLMQDFEDYKAGKFNGIDRSEIDTSTEEGEAYFDKISTIQDQGIDVWLQKKATDNALFTQGGGAFLGARGDTMKLMIPAMQRRLNKTAVNLQIAKQSGDKLKIEKASREFAQEIASTGGLLDVASQVAPENAKILADSLMSLNITPDSLPENIKERLKPSDNGEVNASVGNILELMRDIPELREMRREYGSAAAAQYHSAEEAAAAAVRGEVTGTIRPVGQQ